MEFALTAPLLVGIVVGVIELGIMFSVYIGLTNTAREAARAAVIYRYPGSMPTSATANATMLATIDAQRRLDMSEALTSTLVPFIPAASVVMTPTYLPERNTAALMAANPLRAGDTVSVTLQYEHTLFWGMFGQRTIVLRTTTAARLEPGGGK